MMKEKQKSVLNEYNKILEKIKVLNDKKNQWTGLKTVNEIFIE